MSELIKKYSAEIKRLVRFLLSSGSSFLLDIGLFQVFVWLLKGLTGSYILVATVLARICSSAFNFLVNRKFVFNSHANIGSTAVRYYILCVCQMFASAAGVSVLYKCLPFSESVVKFFVDAVLCVLSFLIQRKVVFHDS